ncbi:T6SS immunity protein Tli4 family protein [Sphaerotilaceae bacterium SBD11-9]
MKTRLDHTLKLSRNICIAATWALLLGCEPSGAQQAKPAPKPSVEELRLATHSGYTTTASSKQECLGRLVFDAPRELQWGINAPGSWSGDRFRFTEEMHGGQDYVGVGNVKVVVSAPAKRADIERMHRSLEAKKDNVIYEYQTSIETRQFGISELERVLRDPRQNVNKVDTSNYPDVIKQDREEIVKLETSIANLQRDWHPMDLGLPDSLGYAAGPTLYAFLLRDGRAYQFMSTGGEGEPKFEERERAFRDMLKRFQVRKMHEIPKALGICIPYGFIPDDGRGHFRTEVSMRYADRPGVIYTIGTAVVGERGIDGPDSTLLQATARAAAGTLTGVLSAGRDSKSIGPRVVTIGALPAHQGGISMNVAEPGKPPVRSYSVYTGYSGWNHSRVLPAITVNLRSFTKAQEPTLKADPPPFEESLARLDALIKSIRLRPTEPVMPELAEALRASPAK